jgi:hypothetical protein
VPRQRGIEQNGLARRLVEAGMINLCPQLDAIDLEQPAHFVFQIEAAPQQSLAHDQQRLQALAFEALHMNLAVPADPQDLRYAARVVAVRLVAQARQGRLDLPGFHDHDAETLAAQPHSKPGSQVAGLQRYTLNLVGKAADAGARSPRPRTQQCAGKQSPPRR